MQPNGSHMRLKLLGVCIVCILGIVTFSGSGEFLVAASANSQAMLVATSAATFAPTSAATGVLTGDIDLPSVDWADLSVYRQAMKPGFESDVDKWVDGNRYLIAATLTLGTNAMLRGAERVRYTNHTTATALNDIVFRLYPNSSVLDGNMTVSNLTGDGVAVSPVYTDRASVMTVPLAEALAPGRSVELTMGFEVVMTGGVDVSYGRFGYKEGVVSGTAWYPTLSVYDVGQGWWESEPDPKGDPAYTETGLYDVRLTTPADLTVVMSGKEIATTTNADGTVTHRGVTGPMRDHAFMASARYTITALEVAGTRINVVHYQEQPAAAPGGDGTPNAVKFAGNSIRTYNRIFGEYPYAELDVVENPTPSGVEFPGLVQIAENSWYADQSYLEVLVSHEIAHQWFYAIIGNNQVELPWLDESLASYSEIVYTREVYQSDEKRQAYIKIFQDRYLQYVTEKGSDLALDLPVVGYDGEGYGAIVYGKGPLFYIRLEQDLGIPTVYRALHTYFNRYKYAVATTDDVEKTFEEVSGKDL